MCHLLLAGPLCGSNAAAAVAGAPTENGEARGLLQWLPNAFSFDHLKVLMDVS